MYKALLFRIFERKFKFEIFSERKKLFSRDNYDNEMESIEEIYDEEWEISALFFMSLSLSLGCNYLRNG